MIRVYLLVALCLLSCSHGGASRFAPLSSAAEENRMRATLGDEQGVGLDIPRFEGDSFTLSNGLRVRVETTATLGLVGSVLTIGSGSSHDPKGRAGLAHLVEHLAFHKRCDGCGDEQSGRLVRIGARYNAETDADATTFYEFAPSSALPKLWEITLERLGQPLLGVNEIVFAREVGIVKNELYQRGELGVYGEITAWMQSALFARTPYERPIGGDAVSLDHIALADAERFASRHYRPGNATLLLVGPPPLQDFLARVRALLEPSGRAQEGEPAQTKLAPTEARKTRVDTAVPYAEALSAAVTLPALWLAYRLPSHYGNDGPIVQVLTGKGAAASIRARLLADPDVASVDLHVLSFLNATVAGWEIKLWNSQRRLKIADKARRLVWSAWSNQGPPAAIAWESWSKHNVDSFRESAQMRTILEAEPFAARTLARARYFDATGTTNTYDSHLVSIANLREQDISEAAFDWLAPERARTLYVDPRSSTAHTPTGLLESAKASVGEKATEARSVPAGSTFPVPEVVATAEGLRDLRQVTLANGLTVIVVPQHRFPVVTMWLGFFGGDSAMPEGLLPLLRAVAPSALEGAGKTAIVSETADAPGYTADVVRSGPRHLSRGLYLLAKRLKNLSGTRWRTTLAQLKRDASNAPQEEPSVLARREVVHALYGDHPYGRAVTLQKAAELSPKTIAALLPKLYSPRNGVLIIAGDVSTDEGMRLARVWFESWQSIPDSVPLQPPSAHVLKTVPDPFVFHRPVTSQVEIVAACPFPPATTAKEAMTYTAASALLGKLLYTALRGESGLTYAFDGEAIIAPEVAMLSLNGTVAADHMAEALTVIRSQLEQAAAGILDKAALSQVRWELAQTAALGYQTTLQVTEKLFESLSLGFGTDAVAKEGTLSAATADADVRAALMACAPHTVFALVGDETNIRKSLTKAYKGPPRAYRPMPPRTSLAVHCPQSQPAR